ncbi:MAG: hypothetical protein ACT4OT_08780 [Acidobacteriota bacterium]
MDDESNRGMGIPVNSGRDIETNRDGVLVVELPKQGRLAPAILQRRVSVDMASPDMTTFLVCAAGG